MAAAPLIVDAQDDATNATTNTVAPTNNSNFTLVLEDSTNESSETIENHGGRIVRHRGGRHGNNDAVVTVGSDANLKAGETADAVVAVGGSAVAKGNVREAVVAVGGDVEVDGEVGDAVVAVLGNVKLGKNARVHDVISIGGRIEMEEGAVVDGHTQQIDFANFFGTSPEWIRQWFKYCALRVRPLAPQVGWVWGIAGLFLALYLLVTLMFPRPVQACVNELTNRPATTFFMGLLTKILTPLVLIILIATGIGLIVVPFVIAALVLGAIVGKAALLQTLGLRVTSHFGNGEHRQNLLALIIGAVIVSLIYMVPVLGLVAFAVVSLWGLGGAVTAAFGGMRREMPAKPTPPTAQPPSGTVPTETVYAVNVPGATTVGTESSASAAAMGSAPTAEAQASIPRPTPAPSLPEVLAYPRAGFWERMGAGFLDFVLIAILSVVVHGPPLAFLVALAYFAGMWGWKGTTVGGIVLGLKVVRTDGTPMNFLAGLVRALAAAFSIFVLFLGMLWIAWDKDKQGWHDRIAGTVVIRTPKSTPLICL